MATQKEFDQALKDVKKLSDLGNQELLELYGLYKQATVGDVSGPKPGTFDLKVKAKYKSWSDCKGIAQKDAMQQYVELVQELRASH